MFIFAGISIFEIILWIIRVSLPILTIYLIYLLLTKAFKYLGFSDLESTIIVIISFIFTFRIVFFGYDISNVTLIPYNNWIVAINTGGALIPIILSFYLIYKRKISYKQVIIATIIVTIVTFFITRVEPSKGIVASFPYWLIPAVFAAVFACISSIILFKKNFAKGATLAYSSSTFGVLIGADFLHLPELLNNTPTKLGTMARIGGAVIFDLIFLTGVIAVLIYGIIMFKYRTNS
jgi:uncharacterized membrane protein